jgi:ABC-type nitrate/sulfonate/bicarbonate transport system substrate-binding protein
MSRFTDAAQSAFAWCDAHRKATAVIAAAVVFFIIGVML